MRAPTLEQIEVAHCTSVIAKLHAMTNDDSSRVQRRLSSLALVRVHHATGPCHTLN
ncbi:Hypothetical predicted protein, partial [Scomber scombrus]